MRFEGEIKETPCIDWGKYYKETRKNTQNLYFPSDFEMTGCKEYYAVVYGKFDDSFCSGAHPESITELGGVEVAADIQLGIELVNRLKKDGETLAPNLAKLMSFVGIDHES